MNKVTSRFFSIPILSSTIVRSHSIIALLFLCFPANEKCDKRLFVVELVPSSIVDHYEIYTVKRLGYLIPVLVALYRAESNTARGTTTTRTVSTTWYKLECHCSETSRPSMIFFQYVVLRNVSERGTNDHTCTCAWYMQR